ncbi:STAS domain-containing protein [Flammeovirga yaeyamensis]|uniref:STAS domain-containing protein n=1 Tax=Flammeovirga yaeyamensis TaxID=367791 RepID=A0AAX1NE79_9BACT|nr:protoglobin domain-containing protein [Flammeovirga yaeyamensis]NMF33789.1 STAS domain-containing protein [Flammeovirga yaeyamensis]QWG04946.1 STAS domain-containing protein [Flammeovirga yaeyamensis]
MDEFSRNAQQLCELYGITSKDTEYIQRLKPIAMKALPQMVESWYKWLRSTPEFYEYFSDPSTLERVQKMQFGFWEQFFDAQIDGGYIESRRKVGEVHARIGLSQEIYLAGVDHFLSLFVEMLLKVKDWSAEDINEARRGLNKMVHMDMTIIVQSYESIVNQKITAQSKTLMAMSTPVTQIWEGLLLLPVVGLIDSRRAQDIMDNTLSQISTHHAQSFILDISGVAVVDTAVANHLIKITKATKLMGCECIISGLSPAVAQTIVELGIDVGTIKTTANLRSAIEIAFDKLNMKIIKQ